MTNTEAPVVTYRRPAGTDSSRRSNTCSSWAGESTCKPDPVPGRERPGGDHPSGHTVTGYLERSTRRLGRAALEHLRSRTTANDGATFDLAPGGVYRATPVTRGAGALLPHRFTLTDASRGRSAVCSLWHCPASHLGLLLATALLCGVRTFLGVRPGDIGHRFLPPRPPGRLVRTADATRRTAVSERRPRVVPCDTSSCSAASTSVGCAS